MLLRTLQYATVYQATEGIVAPRSPRLDIHEIFWVPFKKEAWITIILVLVSSVLLMQMLPNHFQNNLILLALCSFENVALYRVQRLEKTVAISLVIFCFILLSAYESLFISLMTNRPRLHNPRTIQDLIDVGLRIPWKATYEINEELKVLADYVDEYDTSDTFDRHTAHYDDHIVLKQIMRKPENFDFESGESRFVMLDYYYWRGDRYYTFKMFHPLVPKFRFTQTALNEAGFYKKFEDVLEYRYYKSRSHQLLVRRNDATNSMLDIEQMSPAWIVLALGWIVSVFGLLCEWCWFKFRNCYNQKIMKKSKVNNIQSEHQIQITEID